MQESHTHQADQDLVLRAREGDTRAFDALVLRHRDRLHRTVFRMTDHQEDTHELLQEVFAKAYRSLPEFRGHASFYTWLHQIAVNRTRNFLRSRKVREGLSLNDPESGWKSDPAMIDGSHRANPVKQSKLRELQDGLQTAIQSLSEDHRRVVHMFDLHGMPHAEIARMLEVSEGTVRSRLHYAHLRLQAQLSDFWEPGVSPA